MKLKKEKQKWMKKEREGNTKKKKSRGHLLHYLYTLTLLDVKGKDK